MSWIKYIFLKKSQSFLNKCFHLILDNVSAQCCLSCGSSNEAGLQTVAPVRQDQQPNQVLGTLIVIWVIKSNFVPVESNF